MRISLVGPVYPYRGGIAQFTTQLGQKLVENGDIVQAVSFSRQYPAWLYPGKTDKDPSQEHAFIEAQYLLDPLYPWTWLRAAREIKKWQPELVLIQWWTTFWGPALWSLGKLLRSHRLPLAFVIHNVIPHEARFFDRFVVKSTLSNACGCVTLSPQEEQRLADLLPSMPQFHGRLPIGGIPQVHLAKEEARRQLNLNTSEPVLLFFGIVRPYKGLAVLIDALGRLHMTGCKPHLLVAGEFWEDETAYRDRIQKLDLNSQIHIDNRFIPNEEVGVYFSAADLFVAPYVGGSQSAAIKAAMDFGLPVLASERIASDLNGETYPVFIHPTGDDAALADTIQQAIQSGQRMQPSPAGSDGWAELIQAIQAVRDRCNSLK